jgi:tetratricopeptide (TPR) repeat protein
MNRKQRRAGIKRSGTAPPAAVGDDWAKAFSTDDLMAKARGHYEQRRAEAARAICNRILAREPRHVPALNMLGLLLQDTGQHRLAAKEFKKAVAADDLDAACHYNLAASYQALNREDEAASHFARADRRHWQEAASPRDFYSVSGCRDLLFNVMEHRFTIPRIKAFLDRERLTFLGFDLEKPILDQFRTQFPAAALTDLDPWAAFEAAHPQTFRQMYHFMVRRN